VRNLARRVVVALIAIPVAIVVVWWGGLALGVFLAVLAAFSAHEFFRLAAAGGVHAFSRVGVVLAGLIPLVVFGNLAGYTAIPVAAGALALLAVFAGAVWRRVGERPLSAVGATIFGVLYCGGMLAFGYALRYHRFVVSDSDGTALVFLPMVVTWATDTGAYAFGKAFGHRRLMPAVSPGKTIVGAVAGLLAAILATVLYVEFVLRPTAHLAMTSVGMVVFGATVSAAAQIGDLAESLLKREAGVKDSSHLIPGHGGVLDRLDSALFVLPLSYVLVSELCIPVFG
jgi:phosphatidate cytidylyltransferase